MDYLVEQTYLAAEEIDRSEASVRKRFRLFVIPAIERRHAAGGEVLSRSREVERAVAAAAEALDTLGGLLRGPEREAR